MPAFLEEQESQRDYLSGADLGAPITISEDYTSSTDTAVLHEAIADHSDAVWVQIWNSHTAAVDLNLILNPLGTSGAEVDAATMTLTIPAKDSLWVLQGESVRLRAGVAAVQAYVATADAGRLKATGYVVRTKSGDLHAI